MSLSSDIPFKTIDGKAETLRAFDDKALLIVNVASKCGFTPQYAGLEALHKRFRDRGFAVLGFPCDQFDHQEPGDEAEIAKFCSLTYDVSFPMFAKVEVNGPNAHPLYKALKKKAPGLLGTEAIKWNFNNPAATSFPAVNRVRAHLAARDCTLATVEPLLKRRNGRFGDLIDGPASNEAMAALRGAEKVGRPLESPAFLDSLAALTGRDPRPRKRGPRPAPIRDLVKCQKRRATGRE